MGLQQKKHLFFDWDDTLWDFEKNSELVLRELFDEFVLHEKLGADFESFYSVYKRTNQQLWSKYYKKEIDKHYLRNHRFNETFKQFTYDNYAENLLVTEQYLFRSPKGTFLKEGCLETLAYLQQKYQLHIITNGFKEVQDIKIDGSGLRGFFRHIIISEEHALTKPDEKIFRLAEEFTGSQTQDCVMIGDNLETDIRGALGAGWDAVLVSGEQKPNYQGTVIKKLAELKTLF